MNFNVIIPARFSSSRFPGKPLKDICGKPMVCHVIDRARESKSHRVAVATDHEEIFEVVSSYNCEVFITKEEHPSGTDRLQEAASLMGLSDQEIVVNVQGDEPLISPDVINQVALNLSNNPQCSVATLFEKIESSADFFNPNIVKLTQAVNGEALYFSRAPMPWARNEFAESTESLPGDHPAKRHLGIYSYLVRALNSFVHWPETELEQIEKLEQLRFIENNHKIHVAEACVSGAPGVDTPEDLEKVIQILKG